MTIIYAELKFKLIVCGFYQVPKKSQFTLKRKKTKSELDYGELVCPLEQSRADDSPGDASLSGVSASLTHNTQPIV